MRTRANEDAADLCIVNTCTVTSEGDAKSRQMIRRLARQNPAAKIVVMGCYATRAPEEVAALPGVTEVVTDKRELPDLLGRFGVTDVPTGISTFGRRHRAYVKVQDGCLLRCSFCIIPHVRPQLASRPVEHILDEVRRLVDNGYREVVLTGIHLGHYGVDWNRHLPKERWVRLSHLVRRIAAAAGRLPRAAFEHRGDRSDARADRRAGRPRRSRLPASAHLDAERQRRRAAADAAALGQPAVRRPLPAGAGAARPAGDHDRRHRRLPRRDGRRVCRDARHGCRTVGFSKIHIFPFSPRRGTPAATMPDQVPAHVQQERTRELAAVEAELRDAYFASLRGRRLRVLVESKLDRVNENAGGPRRNGSLPPTAWLGTACRYAPVELSVDASRVGRLVDVRAGKTRDGHIIAATQ